MLSIDTNISIDLFSNRLQLQGDTSTGFVFILSMVTNFSVMGAYVNFVIKYKER